jgi:ribosomal protein S20
LAHSSRGWTGARTPSSIKRVRQTARRRAINQPRRSAAKTLVSKALLDAGNGDQEQAQATLARALSALDRAAKSGAIHRNAADRRKSRLTLKVNAALGGETVVAAGKAQRTTGKAAAAKQARARIAASKATKGKGAQTAAGKAREALAKTTRGAAGTASAEDEQTPTTKASAAKASQPKARAAAKNSSAKSAASKPAASKPAASKPAASKPAASKPAASKARATKSPSTKAAKKS